MYLKNLPFATIEALFKNSEVKYEILMFVIRTLKDFGLSADAPHVANFLSSLSKASNFDMTMMFVDSKERKEIADLISELKKKEGVEKGLISKVEAAYK